MIYTQTKTPAVVPPREAKPSTTPQMTMMQYAARENIAMWNSWRNEGITMQKMTPLAKIEHCNNAVRQALAFGEMMRSDLREASHLGWKSLNKTLERMIEEGDVIVRTEHVRGSGAQFIRYYSLPDAAK